MPTPPRPILPAPPRPLYTLHPAHPKPPFTPTRTTPGKACPTCKLFYSTDVFPLHPLGARCPWCRGLRAQRCGRCGVFKLRQCYDTGWGEGVCVDCWPWEGAGGEKGGTQRWEVELEVGLGLGLEVGGQVIGQQKVLRQAVTRRVTMRVTSRASKVGIQLARETNIVPASPSNHGLHIFVGETISCVDTTEDDVWFRSRDPPSLVIVITIMKLRYPLLEDHHIRGVFLQQEGREHLVCSVAEGGEIAWQVMIDQMLRCAPSCRVRVQTLVEGLSYKATITMCEK